MELEGGHRNSVIKRRNPIEFGLVFNDAKEDTLANGQDPRRVDVMIRGRPHTPERSTATSEPEGGRCSPRHLDIVSNIPHSPSIRAP
ncbi:hypothetical protein EVAR_22579_1 [Eumeta japonica]|uniref:Uncharacterized protein n=1 Tax=Eumeta variegata TaxID=151549 RepID=A0A4C1U7B5_EUMVA|nr:hypothetical protein EVAR_22579_1 [Eumeta japonica]